MDSEEALRLLERIADNLDEINATLKSIEHYAMNTDSNTGCLYLMLDGIQTAIHNLK